VTLEPREVQAARRYASLTMAMTKPASTKKTMAICTQIHVGDIGGS
jgi:hypothetical protein